ncbi:MULTISPECIES: ferredoxin [Paenibacillus]|uniref:Ferredoxin n=1 Tax=Paenibacillus rhizophilus TaxID=1850366 RepID=A0A3N9P4U6_9BACL|nr:MULTISPECIES: ferredoxin [Paenibacillus]RQW11208.1 ferredoxin [Paenibacillus rhizophilus]BCG58800.1 ferredoxin [Paenibacillus sp. URB8-2]
MSKYVLVKKDSCIACGSCGSAAPEIFDFDDDGLAEVIFEGDNNKGVTLISSDLLEELSDAVDSCPTSCIKTAAAPFA